jgi:hypothetical protein
MSQRYPALSGATLSDLFTIDLIAGRVFWKNCAREHARLNGKEAGSKRGYEKPYWVIKIDKKAYRRAQIVLAIATGEWPKDCVDHINGNSLDDRAANLRHATVAQNAMNHKTRRKRSNTPMGVRKLPNGKFQARIALDKKTSHLGTFDTSDLAEQAYQAARKEMFHEFA